MIRVTLLGTFNENYNNLILRNSELADVIADKIHLFEKNPDDTRLENHALRKRMKGKYAFSVTDDIRIVYECVGKTTVRFLAIGTHVDVYK